MRIKVEAEIDTDNANDLNTIEELIQLLRSLAEKYED